jgi:hypothetical protein
MRRDGERKGRRREPVADDVLCLWANRLAPVRCTASMLKAIEFLQQRIRFGSPGRRTGLCGRGWHARPSRESVCLDHRPDEQQVSLLIPAAGLVPNRHATTTGHARFQRRLKQCSDADRFSCRCIRGCRQVIRHRLRYIGDYPHVQIRAVDMMNQVYRLSIRRIRSPDLHRSRN